MSRFKEAADVREFINHVMGDNLIYLIPEDFEMKVEYWYKNSSERKEVTVKTIRKNKKESRPRLFGNNDYPVELSYCLNDSLCKAFNMYSDYLDEKRDDAERVKLWNELAEYNGRDLLKEFREAGLDDTDYQKSKVYFENFKNLKEIKDPITLRTMQNMADGATNIMNAYKSLKEENKDYNSMTPAEKHMYHQVMWYVKGEDRIKHNRLGSMWSWASDYNVTIPVVRDLYIYKEIKEFTKMLEESAISKFYLAEGSSALKDMMYDLFEAGYRVTGITLLKESDRTWASEEKALLMEKA